MKAKGNWRQGLQVAKPGRVEQFKTPLFGSIL